MNNEVICVIIVIMFFISLISIHEYEHYLEYKDLNCTNITLIFKFSSQPVGLRAWCPNISLIEPEVYPTWR